LVIVSDVDVAPATSVQVSPESLDTCHCTVVAAQPVGVEAVDLNVADWPTSTVRLLGWRTIAGASVHAGVVVVVDDSVVVVAVLVVVIAVDVADDVVLIDVIGVENVTVVVSALAAAGAMIASINDATTPSAAAQPGGTRLDPVDCEGTLRLITDLPMDDRLDGSQPPAVPAVPGGGSPPRPCVPSGPTALIS
jgi:hypothetical protein